MRRYPEYKESGVAWIGKVPKDWKILRIKHVGSSNPSKTNPKTDCLKDTLVVFLPMERVHTDGTIDQELRIPYSQLKNGYTYFEENDVLIAKVTPCFENGKIVLIKNLATPVGFGSTEFIVIRPNTQKVCPPFLYYLLYSEPLRSIGKHFMTSAVGLKRIPTEFVENFQIPLPTKREQHQIVDFLDRKTGQIDELIRIKEQRIELLQEQRTVLINQVVTKGLDLNVEMKPSGVEWIGETPKHWTMTRLKYLGESIIGLSYKPEDVTDDKSGTLVLRASNIQNGKPSFLDNVYVNAEVDEKLRLKAGDILICSRSGSRELIGKNMTITKKLEGITFGVFMTVFRTKFFRFISYFLNSQVFKNQSGLFLTTTINQLTINTLNNFLICFPADEGEQAQIANFLDYKTGQIDELISAEQRKIELLKEYRQSLIFDVVTGKIDVRSEV